MKLKICERRNQKNSSLQHVFLFFSIIILSLIKAAPANGQRFNSVFEFTDVRPDFSFDAKQTILRGHRVQLLGLRLGIQWQEKYRAGLGYVFLGSKLDEMIAYQGRDVPARLRFGFLAAYGEYTFYKDNKWMLNVGVQPGFGAKSNEHFFANGGSIVLERDFFACIEPYISGNYKILYWIGLGGGLGYRQVLIGIPLSAYRLSGPEVNFTVVIFYGELIKKYITG